MKVEGLDFYYVLTGTTVKNAGCMHEFAMGTDAVEGREKTCIGAKANREEAGKITYGQTTVGVYLDKNAYKDLRQAFADRKNDIPFCVALSEDTTNPTFAATPAPGLWTSSNRSILSFFGYIQSVDWGSEDNGLWQATFTIQRQSMITEVLK